MRKRGAGFLVAAVGCVLAGQLASAHHGITNYNMKKTVVLMGKITAFDWTNPHCLAYVDVADESGHVKHWTLEMSSTYAMSQRGWNKNTLKRGDMVAIETHPAVNGAPVGITAGPGFVLKVTVNGRETPSR
jgi:Family of unknown function (DUF6152)